MPDQRKSRRFDLRLPFELIRSGPQTLLETGETKNLSASGVLFHSSGHVEPGENVEYTITLPSVSDAVEVRLRCKGRVVRCVAPSDAAATLERYEFLRFPTRRPV